MPDNKTLKISVRELAEFTLKSGDLRFGFSEPARMLEGTRGHQFLQRTAGEEYSAEISISHIVSMNGIDLEISGRIDGVIKKTDGVTIDEIKTTAGTLEDISEEDNPVYWGQAKCYAYIYALQNSLGSITVRLTYFNIDTRDTKRFVKNFTLEELAEFFSFLTENYMRRAKALIDWREIRDASIKALDFPFSSYRIGQREMAVAAYKTVRDGGRLFAEAPTGTGKTMASLFPAIKAMGEGRIEKIFYLTARTITRTIAENAAEKMRERGLKLKTLALTAKDKICPSPESACDPEECPLAKGYYDRVGRAIGDIFPLGHFGREDVERYAKKHGVCPFEFSLDLSILADCVICHYNYVFDPRVYLKRFFQDGGGDYAFLIDEAHNLVDRAREMFSARLNREGVAAVRKALKKDAPKLYRSLGKINSYFLKLDKSQMFSEKDAYVQAEPPEEITVPLGNFIQAAREWLAKNAEAPFTEALMDIFFECLAFQRSYDFYDARFKTYFEKIGRDISVKLFCLDPSELLKQALTRGRAAIFFSATLTPLDYFAKILGGGDKYAAMALPSPFPRENLKVMAEYRVSTKYKNRENTYGEIAELIGTLTRGKKGNYLIYFPSYRYMNEVFRIFSDRNPEISKICQKPNMSETEKESFLNEFRDQRDGTFIGFAVMGGIFGEGIDLTGDRLSGAAIVGVGLPQVCLEREIIREYFQGENGRGFEYAYIYPGINKVLQAVGRVIRTETDRGVIILIDERFAHFEYKRLLPEHWKPLSVIRCGDTANTEIENFWNNGISAGDEE
ncbi:MAG TPA: ATP-dependent DNA helicase [Candidatus Wallbacteria bacterium]|nr:ATP-dependent DNA helicase [Candidatus Wallbacteria bacterium]